MATLIHRTAPHPLSYRPDIPLKGFTTGQLHKVTAIDEAYYRAHPIMAVATDAPMLFQEWPDRPTFRPKVLALLPTLAITLPLESMGATEESPMLEGVAC